MKREALLFALVFIVLSLSFHGKEFFSYPIEHIKNLQNAGAYGFGSLHPLAFTFFTYIIILLPRVVVKGLKKLFNKS